MAGSCFLQRCSSPDCMVCTPPKECVYLQPKREEPTKTTKKKTRRAGTDRADSGAAGYRDDQKR